MAEINPNTRKYYIHCLIGISCMIFGRFIPPFATFSAVGMEVLGIFIGTLYLWIATNSVTWPSILALVMLGCGSYYEGSFTAAMNAAITSSTMQTLVLSLSIFSLLSSTKVADQIANRVISSRLVRGRPWVMTVSIIMIAFICAMLKSPYIIIYICWEFIYTICKQTGYTKDDRWTKMVICGVPFATTIGMAGLPFSIGAMGGFNVLSSLSEGKYTFNPPLYTLFALTFCMVVFIIYFIMCRVLIRPDMSKLKAADIKVEVKPFTKDQKFALWLVALYVALAIIPALLPADLAIAKLYNSLTLVGVSALTMVIVLIPRNEKGRDKYTFGGLCHDSNVWNLIVMMAVAAVLGSAMSNAKVGFVELFNSTLGVVFAGRGAYFLAIAAGTAATLMTNVMNNGVTMNVLLPIVYVVASSMGANPIPATLMVIFGSISGFLLPSASAQGAILNSNLDWIKLKDILIYGGVGTLSLIIAMAVFGIPFATVIF